jgi:uncharacterized linocin/CFP29 family protein
MNDLLRRQQAPIAPAAWLAIDAQARELLAANLSARKIIDVSGPHGWHHAAVDLGRLDPGRETAADGVMYGIRKVLPLVEVRVTFSLDLWQLDDVVRGARDPDLEALIAATSQLVAFEERAVYHGFDPAGIVGMAEASHHEPSVLTRDTTSWPAAIAHAAVALRLGGKPPPYTLVTGPAVYEAIERDTNSYPLRRQIESLIGGEILLAPYARGAFLLPVDCEGDFELVLGQDASVGYEQRDGREVHLFLTESFTFRVLEPRSVVAFTLSEAVDVQVTS